MNDYKAVGLNKFYNINHIINANTTEMVDGSKWINWSLDRKKEGHTFRRINLMAQIITE